MAERTFKTAMRKIINEGGDINLKLANFLLVYRKIPQSTTMEAPAMLLTQKKFYEAELTYSHQT